MINAWDNYDPSYPYWVDMDEYVNEWIDLD